jgi:acyl carrier protein
MEVSQAIERYIVGELLEDPSRGGIDHDHPLLEKEVIDSLGVLMLIGFLEQQFGVIVEPSEVTVENFQSVASIARLVEEKLRA